MKELIKLLFAPIGTQGDIPSFASSNEGEADEEMDDESDILSDQDLTSKLDLLTDDENLGAHSRSLDSLEEEEPDEFIEGEIDVKEQMDRAAEAMEASIFGYQNQGTEDSPRTELGAAFRNTPGGLEEVEMKTDQELILKHHPLKGHAPGAKDKQNDKH